MTANKYQYYDEIKQVLENASCTVEEYREINSGLQFNVTIEGSKSLIRVYESKKGIRADLSQIKDEKSLVYISKCIRGSIDFNHEVKEVVKSANRDPDELIGTDESGKGDYFGPLVIAGVYVNLETGRQLKEIGVDDSKKLSDKQIASMALKIKELCPFSIVTIGNEKYNELYMKIKNLNRLLAWGHARAIENVLARVDCGYALSDQFGDPELIKNALMDKGKNIKLQQRPRAEENIAVAAASILARNEYVTRLKQLGDIFEMEFPKGASSTVISAAGEFVKRHGREKLSNAAKLHFKTTEQI